MSVERLSAPAWSPSELRHFRICLAASALLFLAAAVFTGGYLHADEYFQTVEFTSVKLGITDPSDTPWEFPAHLRSWLQPAIYFWVAETANFLGIHRPTILLLLFRLVSGVLSWVSLWLLLVAGRRWIDREEDRSRLYAVAAFLWLLPLLGVRTSAENFATSALCFGIVLLEWRATRDSSRGGFGLAVLGGIAFGLCFSFRFGSAVMAAGAGLWYLYKAEKRFSLFAGLVLGGLMALALGVLADWWGYGIVTFPAYAYFMENFVRGHASAFGTEPFYAYLYLPLANVLAPLTLFLLAATLVAWLRRAGSAVTWATAPYVALLCATPHKETRFLFTLAPFLPFFVVFALAAEPPLGAKLASTLRQFASGRWLRVGYFLNACGLASIVLVTPLPEFRLYELLEDESLATNGPLEVVAVHGPMNIPYVRNGRRLIFLEPPNLTWNTNPSAAELEAKRSRGETFLALVDIPVMIPESADWVRNNCTFVWSTWPRWLEPYNFIHWQDRATWWMLYRCKVAS